MALAVAGVLLGGVVASMIVDGDGEGREVGVRAGGQVASPSSTSSTSSTSSSTSTSTSTATSPSIGSTTAPAVPPPPSTATSAVTTTTVEPPARSFAIEPTAGPVGTRVWAFASGCLAPDGSATGVSLTFFDPSGQAVTGDGATARPDGSWELEFGFPAGPPGDWSIEAVCREANGPTVLFTYPERATYRVT